MPIIEFILLLLEKYVNVDSNNEKREKIAMNGDLFILVPADTIFEHSNSKIHEICHIRGLISSVSIHDLLTYGKDTFI